MTETLKRLFVLTAIISLADLGLVLAQAGETEITPPTGYRQWFHVNSMLIDDPSNQLAGLHNVYVNTAGLEALQRGTPYPNGTVFTDDVHDFTQEKGTYTEGPRKLLAVMVKDSTRYSATGGWGFQAWIGGDPTKPIVTDAATMCFQCHTQRREADFVFSTWIP